MLTQSGQARTYVIPGWVYRAIIRNKLNIIDITDFNKIKPILSNNDIASWIHLNRDFKIMKNPLTVNNLEELFQPVASLKQYDHLASSDEIRNVVSSRLDSPVTGELNANSMIGFDNASYQVVTINDLILVVLNEGFGTFIQSIDHIKKFIQDYLKVYYSVEKIATIAYCPLYRLYVELL